MGYLRYGVNVNFKDEVTAAKRVNESVEFLAQRLADGHSLYGKNHHEGRSLDIWNMHLVSKS